MYWFMEKSLWNICHRGSLARPVIMQEWTLWPPLWLSGGGQDERPQDISEAALCPAGCAGCCAGRLGVSWRRAGAALVSGPAAEAHQE